MDFSKTLIRCSGIHKIMTDSVESRGISEAGIRRITELELKLLTNGKLTDKMSAELVLLKTKRDNPPEPELSETAISELVSMYLFQKFGVSSVNKGKMIRYTEKGKLVENDAIEMVGTQDGVIYTKNDVRFNNEWLTGEPDILIEDHVKDVKSSWDAETFLKNIGRPLKQIYYWQMQGYMALTGAKTAQVCYCLIDTPDVLVVDEKRRLMYAMGLATDEDPIYQILADAIEHNMKFSFMDPRLRIMRFDVQKNDADIQKVYERVEMARKWLQKLDFSHENL